MASTFPKVKKSFSWDISSVPKEEVIYFARPNRTKQILRWNHQPNELQLQITVVETVECIEPNENDLKINAIGDTFSKIFKPEM